jgi:hypothetical protein
LLMVSRTVAQAQALDKLLSFKNWYCNSACSWCNREGINKQVA